MRTSRFHFICWLLPFAVSARAQVVATQPHGPIYYLDLSQQHINLPMRTMYVEQVLDGRPGKPAIGLVYRGLQNQQAAMLFRMGLEPELTAYLYQQLPQRSGDQNVVLCVRQLRVDEVLNGLTEKASADFSADVYAHLSDGYHFVRTVASHTAGRALETTAMHAPHIALVLQQSLAQLDNVDWAQAAHQPARSLHQLPTDRAPASARPAVLRAPAPHEGIYTTFEQFLANAPELVPLSYDTIASHLRGWEGTIRVEPRIRNLNGKHTTIGKVWGFSDGQQAYIRYRNAYRPLNRQGSFFTFVGPAPLDVAAANQRAMGYAVRPAGMMGSRPPATGGRPSNGTEDTSGQPMVYALDMHTGEAIPFPPPGLPQPADTAFIYIYRPLGGDASAVRLFLNDREAGQLLPGQYIELFSPHVGNAIRLSANTAGGPTLYFVPDAATANYVKLTVSDKAATPWQWVPVRKGESEVDALEKPRK